MKKVINYIKGLQWMIKNTGLLGFIKSIYFNFKYFDFHTAWKLPVWLTTNVKIHSMHRNAIEFVDGVRNGILSFGVLEKEWYYNKSTLSINGKLAIKGLGWHKFSPGLILIIGKDGYMSLDDNFSIGRNALVACAKNIAIGKNNMWSFDNIIMDTDSHPMLSGGGVINPDKEIIIGDNVWLGCRCTILKGVHIANNTIIGSNSLVRKDITEENTCNAGNGPIKIHDKVSWKEDLIYRR